MTRPTLEVADILRVAGSSFWERQGSHLAWQHRKVMDAIVPSCRPTRRDAASTAPDLTMTHLAPINLPYRAALARKADLCSFTIADPPTEPSPAICEHVDAPPSASLAALRALYHHGNAAAEPVRAH